MIWRGEKLWKSVFKKQNTSISSTGWEPVERTCEDGNEASLWLKAMYMLYIHAPELVSIWYLSTKREQFPHRKASVGDFSTFSCCSVSAALLAICQFRSHGTKAHSQTFWLVTPVRKCGQDRISHASCYVKINVGIPEVRRQKWLQNDYFSPVQKIHSSI
jgi:hypothetical protein